MLALSERRASDDLAAFRAMRWAAVPPTRRAVSLARGDSREGEAAASELFNGRAVRLFESGTQALGAAIVHLARGRALAEAEVIIPAYGCPDLISACVLANVRARIVDVAADGWGYDRAQLAAALSPRTVAIVAVNLLGVGDGASELLPIARAAHTYLIQDSAQHLPRAPVPWPGDCVVLSFGRGKPLNLLGGGALVLPAGAAADAVPAGQSHRLPSSRLAALAFNVATSPFAFNWVARLPGMGLGETHYKAPTTANAVAFDGWSQVGPALRSYRHRASYSAAVWAGALEEWRQRGISRLTLSGADDSSVEAEPLRLALLAPDRTMRDRIVEALSRAGLGASRMYGEALHRIPGIPGFASAQGPFANAMALADRLFTLPTHCDVTPDAVARAIRCVHGLS
jgi:dTDP-4-amino-4,6-dideoxygalactose transaminase